MPRHPIPIGEHPFQVLNWKLFVIFFHQVINVCVSQPCKTSNLTPHTVTQSNLQAWIENVWNLQYWSIFWFPTEGFAKQAWRLQSSFPPRQPFHWFIGKSHPKCLCFNNKADHNILQETLPGKRWSKGCPIRLHNYPWSLDPPLFREGLGSTSIWKYTRP